MRDDPVPPEHELALAMWKCHHLAVWGLAGDSSVTWWTLPHLERSRWLECAHRFDEGFLVARRYGWPA